MLFTIQFCLAALVVVAFLGAIVISIVQVRELSK